MPVMARMGAWSIFASSMPFIMCTAPGPAVEKHTPSLPVNFAYPTPAIAATSSWRTWM